MSRAACAQSSALSRPVRSCLFWAVRLIGDNFNHTPRLEQYASLRWVQARLTAGDEGYHTRPYVVCLMQAIEWPHSQGPHPSAHPPPHFHRRIVAGASS
jgi:hypothetical protein